MSDYLRKPAIGTAARERLDEAQSRRRLKRPCPCRSGHWADSDDGKHCIACSPATRERWAAMTGKELNR